MRKYHPSYELHPTPNNPLVTLVAKIEELIEDKSDDLAISALISAALRLETHLCDGNERVAAKALALALEEIAQKSNN
jgi:hypothetical protein